LSASHPHDHCADVAGATLDREALVTAALRLAQRRDPVAMSFRAIGRELGADPTAVYRHFRDGNE
jgi:AcrR family transcriptional regulator